MFITNRGASQRIRQTVNYYLALLALGLTTGAIGPALPHLAEQTHSPIQDISYLFVSLALGYLLGSLAGGRLIDRIKGHPVIIAGLVGMAITTALIPLTPDLRLLILLAFMVGLSQSFVDVGGNLMIVWLYGQDVGPFMNGLHLSFGIGTLISPLIIAGSLEFSGSIIWGFLSLAVLSLPAAIGLMKIPNPTSPVNHYSQHKDRSQKSKMVPLVIFIMLFYFLYIGFEGGFGAWLYTYAFERGLATQVTAAYLTSVFWGAFTFGRLLGIPAARKISPGAMIFSGLILSLISIILLSAYPSSTTMLWCGTFGYGLGVSTLFPTLLTLASQYMTLSGTTTSLFFASASAGGMFFPWLVGQLIGIYGLQIMMPALLSIVLSAFFIAAVVLIIGKRLKKHTGKS
jgi:FHS family Na+ dependent glucose MFS transporter 1